MSSFSSVGMLWFFECETLIQLIDVLSLKLFVMLHLALFYYLSIIIADKNMSLYGQVRRVIGQISI